MNNHECWALSMRDVLAPAHFKQWGWWFTVGAALERRVQLEASADYPILPNQYITLVGDPGTGKGLVTDKIKSLLSIEVPDKRPDRVKLSEAAAAGRPHRPKLLFKMAPDSITYEAFLVTINHETALIKTPKGPVFNSPMCFILDELTSLFVEKQERLGTALLTMWNGKDYANETKHSGSDFVHKPVINLIAGTTPDMLRKVTNNDLVGTGMSSRMIFVYSARAKQRQVFIPPADEMQLAAEKQMRDYLRGLAEVQATLRVSPEAREWAEQYANSHTFVRNHNPVLDNFYNRKMLHIWKLALIIRMSEPGWANRGDISKAEMVRAAQEIEYLEPYMHIPLLPAGRNPLHPIGSALVSFLDRNRGKWFSEIDLLKEFERDLSREELTSILIDLQAMHKINYVREGTNSGKYTFNPTL